MEDKVISPIHKINLYMLYSKKLQIMSLMLFYFEKGTHKNIRYRKENFPMLT